MTDPESPPASAPQTASYLADPDQVHRVLLLYSGGLDTSVMLKWIQERYGAPLILLSNGPEPAPPGYGNQPDLQYLPAFNGLRSIGAPVNSIKLSRLSRRRCWPKALAPVMRPCCRDTGVSTRNSIPYSPTSIVSGVAASGATSVKSSVHTAFVELS